MPLSGPYCYYRIGKGFMVMRIRKQEGPAEKIILSELTRNGIAQLAHGEI